MTVYPTSVEWRATLTGATLADVCHYVQGQLTDTALPAIVGWAMPITGKVRADGLEQALAQLPPETSDTEDAPTLRLDFGDAGSASLFAADEAGNDRLWEFRMHLRVTPDDPGALRARLAALADLCRTMLREGRLRRALCYREGHGLQCFPTVPLAGGASHFFVTTQAEVKHSYDPPGAFWKADWSDIEKTGGEMDDSIFVARGLDIADNLLFLAHIQPDQWLLARAARPGLTAYFLPEPTDAEMPIYKAGEALLHPVGYVEGKNSVTFACAPEPDTPLHGWEIYTVWQILAEGKLPDGRRVDEARVLFPDRATAEREKRPLLDVGAKMFYLDEQGAQKELRA